MSVSKQESWDDEDFKPKRLSMIKNKGLPDMPSLSHIERPLNAENLGISLEPASIRKSFKSKDMIVF